MVKGSEYKKAFKERPETAEIHQYGFDYRLERRRAEHHHSIDAFLWDTGSETDSDQSDNFPRPGSVPPHKLKHEKFNLAYKERVKQLHETHQKETSKSNKTRAQSKKLADDDLHIDLPTPVESAANGVECQENGLDQLKANYDGIGHTEDSKPKSHVTCEKDTQTVRKGRPKKPVTGIVCRKFIPKPKPVSAEVCRPLRPDARDNKPPFVSYGCMDKKKDTSTKKTYNIRASDDVYPSALRAMKRREISIKKREDEEKAAPFQERRKKALFNDFDLKMKRETTQWNTEYRNHFVGYDETEYKRSVSARAPSRGGKCHDGLLLTM